MPEHFDEEAIPLDAGRGKISWGTNDGEVSERFVCTHAFLESSVEIPAFL